LKEVNYCSLTLEGEYCIYHSFKVTVQKLNLLKT